MCARALVELHNISSRLTTAYQHQKSAKQSPRWQQGNSGGGVGGVGGYGGTGTGCGLIVDGRSRDEKLGAPDGMEDERDPDVIPAQFGKARLKQIYFNQAAAIAVTE